MSASVRQDSIPRASALQAARDYWTLTKPEVNALVGVSTLAGYILGQRGPVNIPDLFAALVGTLLVASGTGTLNQYLESVSDAAMRRTAARPVAAQRIGRSAARNFGLALAAAGGALLWWTTNPLASLLALGTLASYLLFYTPLKKRTPLCTLVGAFPGAMPPLIGWAAARGSLSPVAWELGAILFFWQFPHFLAIAWMYREDYAHAGLRMLPRRDSDGRFTSREVFAFMLALIPISLLPVVTGHVGLAYAFAALGAGIYFAYYGVRFLRARTAGAARQVLFASIAYLPVVLGFMVISSRPM